MYFGSLWIDKTVYGRIFTESSRRPYCKKRKQFITALQFDSQIYSYASSKKKSSSKSSSEQGMGKIGENSGVEPDKSQKWIRGRWSKDVGRKSSFCITDGHLSLEKCWAGGKAPKIQRFDLYSEVILSKTIQGLMQYSPNKDHQLLKWEQKSHGYHLQDCHDVQDSSRRSISLYPSENGRCSQMFKIPKSEWPDIWIRLPRHKWPKSWSSIEDPVVPLERNLYGHPLAGLFWKKQFGKILLKHGWEKVSNWECLFVHRLKWLFLSVYVDDIKLAGKKQNLDPMWKVLNKEVDLGEPTSFLDHVYLGCTQRQCEISKDIVDNYRTMFESRISAVRTEKLSILWESSYLFMIFWYGGSCKEVCGAILWVGKQNDSTTLQSIYPLHRWPSPQTRRNEICWRIVTNMLSNCSKMFILDTNWKTWYSMVSEQTCTIHHEMD